MQASCIRPCNCKLVWYMLSRKVHYRKYGKYSMVYKILLFTYLCLLRQFYDIIWVVLHTLTLMPLSLYHIFLQLLGIISLLEGLLGPIYNIWIFCLKKGVAPSNNYGNSGSKAIKNLLRSMLCSFLDSALNQYFCV